MKFKVIFLLSLVIIGNIYSSSGKGSGSGKGSKGKGSKKGKGPKKKSFNQVEIKSFGKFSF